MTVIGRRSDGCVAAGAKGNLVADAFHAALAIESGAEFITTDRDFSRFPGLRWRHPLDGPDRSTLTAGTERNDLSFARRASNAPWHVPMAGRDPEEPYRSSTPLELLFDLCFVVAVAQAAGALHHDLVEARSATASWLSFVFFAIWWPWMNFTWFASAYDTDDVPTGC